VSKTFNSDLKKRIIFTLLVILAYRFGTFVPIPGLNSEVVAALFSQINSNIFGMVNLFSGGALQRMSIFALNIMPYITSSIIMQLLTSMYPSLSSLKKDGNYGRAKINQYTKYLTIFLALFQALGVYYTLSSSANNAFIDNSLIYLLTTIICLVGGTIILMWFGEKITSNGIGNGISLIIFVGIVSSLPSSLVQVFSLSKSGAYSVGSILLFFAIFILIFWIVCFIEKTYKNIKIQYSNSTMMRMSGMKDHSYLPLKINLSGVIPPIFASSILMFPTALIQFSGVNDLEFLSFFSKGSPIYFLAFSFLIVFFCFFYSSIVFNTEEVANNLKKNNCFIFGIRPGVATAGFLDKKVSRITLIGSLYLVIICVMPEILISKFSIPLQIGGTGILIIVNVVMDLVNQIQSYNISSKYSSGQRRRIKVSV
jgi:preprotein translocase subunit SecY